MSEKSYDPEFMDFAEISPSVRAIFRIRSCIPVGTVATLPCGQGHCFVIKNGRDGFLSMIQLPGYDSQEFYDQVVKPWIGDMPVRAIMTRPIRKE